MSHVVTITFARPDGVVESETTIIVDAEAAQVGHVNVGIKTPVGERHLTINFDPPLITRHAVRVMGGVFPDEVSAEEESDETTGQ